MVTPPDRSPSRHHSAEFKPKNDADYIQHIEARTAVKTRKHEKLVKMYGTDLLHGGFEVATNVHPVDMTAKRGAETWLVEAKVVYQGNGVQAARDALSQLYAYRHFLYASQNPRLLALFNESIGDRCVDLLESVGITAVWRGESGWLGSGSAREHGLSTDLSLQ